jgi:hypothetical protein
MTSGGLPWFVTGVVTGVVWLDLSTRLYRRWQRRQLRKSLFRRLDEEWRSTMTEDAYHG